MKRIDRMFLLFIYGVLIQSGLAKTIIVDKAGLGQYTTIQAGINSGVAGDTVKVFPGVYSEQVNISTNLVVQGSGYEYTQIVANTDPAVSMSNGKIMWFAISSNTGRGVAMSGGVLTNCVVWNCGSYGVDVTGGSNSMIVNTNIVDNNANYQARVTLGSTASVINTILWYGNNNVGWVDNEGKTNVLYCVVNNGGTGCLASNPQFISRIDFVLTGGSPCIDAGKPDIYDPDGSRSDIGYYGGADAPVFPVVTNLRIYLNPDGSVNVQATAQSRY